MCTPATAPLYGIRQAVAVESIEKAVNPRVAVTARVEARRRRGALELAAALLCIELRLRLGGKLLRLRGRGITGGHFTGGRGRPREVNGKVGGATEGAAGRTSSESTVMAAQSTFEAQSFPDHTSAPFSTTTSLATPSAMSTACDGVREWEDGRQRHPTLFHRALRCSRSCLMPSASACSRNSMWRAAALSKTATCNRSRRLVGHRCLEEHRSRRELGRRGHGVQPLHRRDVSVDVADLCAQCKGQSRSLRSATAPPRPGYTAWRDRRPPSLRHGATRLGMCAAACEPDLRR